MQHIDKPSNKNMPIFKTAGNLGVLYFIFLFIWLLATLNHQGTTTNLGFISMVINIVCVILILVCGLIFRRALYIHLIILFASFNMLVPLIDVGTYFHSNTMNFVLIMLFVILNTGYGYKSTIQRIYQPDNPIEKFGRLDRKQAFWNLEKHFFGGKRNARTPWVGAVLSIGPILGAFLYRSYPGESNLISAILCTFLACFLAQVPSVHLAILSYLVHTEKHIEKQIQV